jgi:CheY-like chemotaxis protein
MVMAYLLLILRGIESNQPEHLNMPDHIKTIFFVEDSEVELLAYRVAMEKAGHCVQWAKDGLEAMRLLHNLVPDLVLLDLMLPRFDGVEVLKFISSSPKLKTVPVIIFSTNSIIDCADEPLLESATRRILKSQCTPPKMLRVIDDIFAGRKAVHTAAPDGHEQTAVQLGLEPAAHLR